MALTEQEELELLELEEEEYQYKQSLKQPIETQTQSSSVQNKDLKDILSNMEMSKHFFKEGPADSPFTKVPIVGKPIKFVKENITDPLIEGTKTLLTGSEEETTPMKTALKYGGQEGLTLGFTGEIGGGIQAGLDVGQSILNKAMPGIVDKSPTQVSRELEQQGFSGDLGPSSTEKMYDVSRAEIEAQIKQAQEESPGAFLTGQLLGGLAGAIPTGGYGSAAIAAKVAPKLKQVKLLSNAPKFVNPVLTEAISSAPMGAAYGIGSAEPGERLEGALTGAATGSLTGAAVQGATILTPIVAKKLGDLTNKSLDWIFKTKPDSSTIAKIREQSYISGTEGKRLTNPEFVKGLSKDAQEMGLGGTKSLSAIPRRTSEDVTSKLLTLDRELSQEVGNAINNSPNKFTIFDKDESQKQLINFFYKVKDEAADILSNKDFKFVLNKILKKESLTAKEVHNLSQELFEIASRLEKSPLSHKSGIAKSIKMYANEMRDMMKNTMPDYAYAMANMKSFRDKVLDPFVQGARSRQIKIGNKDVDLIPKKFSDNPEAARETIANEVSDIIQDMNREGVGITEFEFWKELKNSFDAQKNFNKTLKVKNPIIDKIDETLDSVVKNIEDSSLKYETIKRMHKEPSLSEPGTAITPSGVGKKLLSNSGKLLEKGTIQLSNVAGRIKRGIQEGKISKEFEPVLNKLSSIGLNQSVQKNALINTLMQNNTIREFLKNDLEESNETDEINYGQ